MSNDIPENSAPIPLMPLSIIEKALAEPSDDIMINIAKVTDPDDLTTYGYFQAAIRRGKEAVVVRTKIPEKKDYLAALSITLMSIMKEVESGIKK